MDWPEDGEVSAGPWAARTLLFSVLCFVLIPFAIYTAAYIPYAQAREVELFAHSDTNGLALLFQNVWGKLTFAGEGKFEGAYIPQDNLLAPSPQKSPDRKRGRVPLAKEVPAGRVR